MPKPTTITTEAILHEKTNLGIHLVTIQDRSRNAVVALMALIEEMYTDTASARGAYILVDATKYTLPLTPTIRQVIQLERKYPKHVPMTTAVLLNLDMAVMVDTMLTPLRGKNQIRLFTLKDRERAMQWLLARQAIDGVKSDLK